MANIVKITDVQLYAGFSQGVADAFECKKILDAAGVKYSLLMYHDEPTIAANVAAISTWTFGSDFKQYAFTDFPVIVWKEFYDDYERFLQVATSSKDLAASTLIANKGLVK